MSTTGPASRQRCERTARAPEVPETAWLRARTRGVRPVQAGSDPTWARQTPSVLGDCDDSGSVVLGLCLGHDVDCVYLGAGSDVFGQVGGGQVSCALGGCQGCVGGGEGLGARSGELGCVAYGPLGEVGGQRVD